MSVVQEETVEERRLREHAEHEINVRRLRFALARDNPAFLLQFMRCVDAKTGEQFEFDLLDSDERKRIDLPGDPGKWFWHRPVLDSWQKQTVTIEYKARQIGITWLAAGYGLWMTLMRPGTRVLIISINLEEAQKVIARVWSMYLSLPGYLTRQMMLTKPSRGGAPSQEIEWVAPDGRTSAILALPSTPKAGHGETAALVILDEFARQDWARESWKASFPIIDGGSSGGGGRAVIISTANGISTEDGEGEAQGNYFHYLWTNAESMKIERRFHSVFTHPDRDERWYAEEAVRLPYSDRCEQYPRTPEEGFIGSGSCWFDVDKLNRYQERWRAEQRKALYRLDLEEGDGEAAPRQRKDGDWRVYVGPERGHSYAIFADVATGTGDDFSAASVIDLSDGRWVAEYHARVGEDVFAKDLYYVGKWYGAQSGCPSDALIAVETQGGYGRAVVIPLRDGVKGRKPYNRLYRHSVRAEETIEPRERQQFGFPMNVQTRPLLISQMEQWIRDELCPWITPDLDSELRTFSKRTTMPSPRALPGCNDDRVVAAMGSLELYRQYGTHAKRYRRRPSRKDRWRASLYSWES